MRNILSHEVIKSFQRLIRHSLHSSTARKREYIDEITQQYEAKLSEAEVKNVFALNEVYREIHSPPIHSFSANQISVNRPVEDRWNGSCFGNMSTFHSDNKLGGFFFNVADGHAGHACAHAVNLRLHDYVAVSLLDSDSLYKLHMELKENPFTPIVQSYLQNGMEPWGHLSTAVKEMHSKQILKYIDEILSTADIDCEVSSPIDSIRSAFMRLDSDMVSAALPSSKQALDRAVLRIVLSGCVNTMLYVPAKQDHIFVSQTGDCEAVMGVYDDNCWISEKLAEPHNDENESEVERIKSEHPVNESTFLIRDGRLLGELMPLRAFGDVRFKWKATELKYVASLLDIPPSYPVMPSFYYTPPYLTARPDVMEHPIRREKDRFIILASDGLWEQLAPGEAVKIVADCIEQGDLRHSSTALIQAALGGTRGNEQVDYVRISSLLSMPANVARYYRDDITVIVVFLRCDPPSSDPDQTFTIEK